MIDIQTIFPHHHTSKQGGKRQTLGSWVLPTTIKVSHSPGHSGTWLRIVQAAQTPEGSMLDSRNEFSSFHLTMNLKNLELRHLLTEKSKYESGDSKDEPELERQTWVLLMSQSACIQPFLTSSEVLGSRTNSFSFCICPLKLAPARKTYTGI